MDTLASIRVFRQVVDSGSFVAAADRLDMSTAMVSKHVKHIEKRVGVRLLNRNSRTLSLTEPGRVYYERCRTILDDLEQTELELGSLTGAARGTLRITAPSWFAGQALADFLAAYRKKYPEIVIDLSLEDRFVDIVEEGFDLALRITSQNLAAGLIARPIRTVGFFVAGSRDYLKRNGTPRSPEDLGNHDCVGVGHFDTWQFSGRKGDLEVKPRIVLRYRGTSGLANAAAAGIGLAPVPEFAFEEPLLRDVLVSVLPEYPLRRLPLYAVYVSRKYVPLKIRSFIDHLADYSEQLAKTAPRR